MKIVSYFATPPLFSNAHTLAFGHDYFRIGSGHCLLSHLERLRGERPTHFGAGLRLERLALL